MALCSTLNLLNSPSVFADDTTINITSTPTISLETSEASVTLDVSPTSAGSFQTTPLIVTAGTNNPNGYTLYFSVADNSTSLTGSNGSISALDNNGATGYTPDSFTMNRWGYSIGNIADPTNDTTIYHPAPTIASPTIIDTYNNSINMRNTTINLATKVDFATAAGSYSKQLVVSMLPTVVAYELSYDANTTDTVANLPSTTIVEQWSDVTPTLIINTAKIPTRAGYNFLGYSTTSGATTAEYTYDATTSAFTPATLTPSTTSSTLYAVWEKISQFDLAFAAAGKTKIAATDGKSYYKMQDMSTSICNAVTTGTSNDGSDTQVAQLIDTRDNKVYWVAKLKTTADGSTGECWMTQNLDYNISASTNVVSNTDGTTSTWTSSATYKPTATATTASSNSTDTATYSWDLGNYYWHPQDNTSWTSCGNSSKTYADCSATGKGFKTTVPTKDIANKDIDGAHYQVGTLYQWNAATAGTGGTIKSADATSSICPANWRLPTSNSTTADRSFGKMLTAYGYSSWSDKKTISQAPLFFVPAGYVLSDTLRGAGRNGYYWSSMAYSNTSDAYLLTFYSTSVNPSHNYYRYFGYSVRCVAR